LSKISLKSQVAAIETFLRLNVRIDAGSRGTLHREHMQAALDTLKWLERNEEAVKPALGGRS
jgi:hypothetical protein